MGNIVNQSTNNSVNLVTTSQLFILYLQIILLLAKLALHQFNRKRSI